MTRTLLIPPLIHKTIRMQGMRTAKSEVFSSGHGCVRPLPLIIAAFTKHILALMTMSTGLELWSRRGEE